MATVSDAANRSTAQVACFWNELGMPIWNQLAINPLRIKMSEEKIKKPHKAD